MTTYYAIGELVIVFGSHLGEILAVHTDEWFSVWIDNNKGGIFLTIHADYLSHHDI